MEEADLYANFPLSGFTDECWTGRQNQSDSQRKPYVKKYHLPKKKWESVRGEGRGGKHSASPISVSKIGLYFLIVPHTDKGSKNHQGKDFKKQSTSFSLPVNRNMDRILRRKNAVINKLQGSACIQSTSTFTLWPWGCKSLSYNIKDQRICP